MQDFHYFCSSFLPLTLYIWLGYIAVVFSYITLRGILVTPCSGLYSVKSSFLLHVYIYMIFLFRTLVVSIVLLFLVELSFSHGHFYTIITTT